MPRSGCSAFGCRVLKGLTQGWMLLNQDWAQAACLGASAPQRALPIPGAMVVFCVMFPALTWAWSLFHHVRVRGLLISLGGRADTRYPGRNHIVAEGGNRATVGAFQTPQDAKFMV